MLAILAITVLVWSSLGLSVMVARQSETGAAFLAVLVTVLTAGGITFGVLAEGATGDIFPAAAVWAGRSLTLAYCIVLATALILLVRGPELGAKPAAATSLWLTAVAIGLTQVLASLLGSGMSFQLLLLPLTLTVIYMSTGLLPSAVRSIFSAACLAVVWASLAAWAAGFDWALSGPRRVPMIGDLRLAGVAPHANALGLIAAIAIVAVLASPRRRLWWLNSCAALLVLWGSDSRGAMAAAAGGLAVLWASQGTHARLRVSALALGLGSSSLFLITGLLAENTEHLNGRTVIAWPIAVDRWLESPIVGSGMTAFDLEFRTAAGASWVGQAHNQLLNSLAQTGLIGAAALVILLIVSLSVALKARRATNGLSMALLTVMFLAMLLESPISMTGTTLNVLPVLFLLAYLITCASPIGTARTHRPEPDRPSHSAPR